MRAAGFTRQWRYKWSWQCWCLEEAEGRGLRWCIRCGKALSWEARLDALFCSASCRERARQMRRARGIRCDAFPRGPVKAGEMLDWRELAKIRARSFRLCHGQEISRAPAICPKWGKR